MVEGELENGELRGDRTSSSFKEVYSKFILENVTP
jgi:hypothetical protein